MKRTLVLPLAAILCLSFAGCFQQNDGNSSEGELEGQNAESNFESASVYIDNGILMDKTERLQKVCDALGSLRYAHDLDWSGEPGQPVNVGLCAIYQAYYSTEPHELTEKEIQALSAKYGSDRRFIHEDAVNSSIGKTFASETMNLDFSDMEENYLPEDKVYFLPESRDRIETAIYVWDYRELDTGIVEIVASVLDTGTPEDSDGSEADSKVFDRTGSEVGYLQGENVVFTAQGYPQALERVIVKAYVPNEGIGQLYSLELLEKE